MNNTNKNMLNHIVYYEKNVSLFADKENTEDDILSWVLGAYITEKIYCKKPTFGNIEHTIKNFTDEKQAATALRTQCERQES